MWYGQGVKRVFLPAGMSPNDPLISFRKLNTNPLPLKLKQKRLSPESPHNSIGKPIAKAAPGTKTTSTKAKASSSTATEASNNAILSQFDVVIYTDGGCEPNPGKAGSGVAVYRQAQLAELWYGLFNPNGTNNTAELNALHQALLMAKTALDAGHSVQIMSDSQYSIKCISEWAYGLRKSKG
ncbi:hypothetical protein PEC18_35880 [Paucibacter sp. O1-1]|nr:hypothetical protein [Paucibacter sp. O1-1]MDA3831038.1 hypothetical protein [Paucibacter sp. O1-1]